MTVIRTLIVDDEAPARQWLRSLCSKHPQLHVIGECSNAADAAQRLRTTQVDLLLLDIRLGPHNGFQVLEHVPPNVTPLVVIVTAFDEYAVRAFEKNAVDYLLKPVSEERFRASLDRVRRQLGAGLTTELREQIAVSVGSLRRALFDAPQAQPPARLVGERDGSFYLIDAADIEFLESSGNYVLIHAAGQQRHYSLRSTLHGMEERLDPASFLRISRSVIVNLAHVMSIERDSDSAFSFVLNTHGRVSVGRTYRTRVAEFVRSSRPPATERGPVVETKHL
ncbi:MAG TPA: LytTR family DNA-binding domain-containing protein [Steroidobacteraceae bacterium]|nr:LytTR family DNA-binding domain-containing protein [Steroidobacteraceae bacterium]